MKKLLIILFFFSATFLSSGCKKSFITDVISPTYISQDGYYTSDIAFQGALTGIYGYLRVVYNPFFRLAEVPSDNTLSTATVNADTGPLDGLTWLTSDVNVLACWKNAYSEISYSNNFIEQLNSYNMSDTAQKARWIGEAKFVRALMYFNLVRFYGDIPLVLKKLNSDAESYNYLRVPVADVYVQIIKDLQDAETAGLPVKYTAATDIGKVTVGAVKSLLGKVYLTQARWSDAANKLKELLPGNTFGISYSLLPNYADVFSITNETNAEIIFSVQYARGTSKEGSNFCQYFFPSQSGVDLLTNLQAKGLNQGTKSLYNLFGTGDTRKITAIQSYTNSTTTYYTRKYVDNPPVAGEGENNWIVLRYADVVLMYAEALNELNNATAATYLNQIRARAGLAAKTGLTQAALRTQIDLDRRLELCFEGHRWFDLVRTGNMVTALQTEWAADGFSFIAAPYRSLFPIPFRDVTLNPNLTQNPGY